MNRWQRRLLSVSFWRDRKLPTLGKTINDAAFVSSELELSMTIRVAGNSSGIYIAVHFFRPLTSAEYAATKLFTSSPRPRDIAELVRKAVCYALHEEGWKVLSAAVTK